MIKNNMILGVTMEDKKDIIYSYLEKNILNTDIYGKNRTYDEDKKFKYRKVFDNLKNGVDDFLGGYKENRYVVMPGLRGVGKSTLLFQLYEYLTNEKGIEKDRILYLSMDFVNKTIKEDIYTLIETFIERFHNESAITLKKKLFIFIDEAHLDPDWSITGKIFYDQSNEIFMVFTGSSALEFELNLDAVRRTQYQAIYPLNFKEYLYLKYDNESPKNISEVLMEAIITGKIEKALKKEREIINKLNLNRPYDQVWKSYLLTGGFPNSITTKEIDIYSKTYRIISRVVEEDLPHYKEYKNGTIKSIYEILRYLALQKPGELSESKLASSLGISSGTIHDILKTLVKTHLIFPVTPYGGVGKQIRKPYKYYFLSPTLKSTINDVYGWYSPNTNEFLGILSENLVASTFHLMMKNKKDILGLFYPTKEGNVDFILKTFDEKIIPVEVGIGKKGKKQVKTSMNKYASDHGVVISNKTPYIKKEEDIIYMPLTTFSFI